ncbi:DsbA family protein [Haloarcula halophila]|uniref:DsbA family protein n=1 Tax=Haloarcula TaxID=2237 RepID=UPI0023E41D75|nr:thioredoxin domain-containing protein [Halomicroarcula sp. DFY41]
MNRRRFLGLATASVVTGVAGCGGSEASGESISDHPAAADLDAQPHLGSLDGHVVLTFEDPSCPTCRDFHDGTVPQIQSEIVEPGKGAYVVRTYPVIYPWGAPATQALEATFARDADAFWSLLAHYFETQSAFSTDNVLGRTATFLDGETDLDGQAVVADAREQAYDEQVQADISAADNAGLGESTPIILLFEDGEFVTKVTGSVSYEIVARALGESE